MKFIDFFAGIGGFRLGMELADHECVGHCEINKFAEKSYRAMHNVKEDEWYATDIRNVTPECLPESNCWCGGFPCQTFSIAGRRQGFEDMRGTLIFEILRLARYKKPEILLLENVKGLFSHDRGRTFGTILYALDELGYDAEWQLLNSKNYGVPQNRERVFIIGHLRGASTRQVFPIFGSNSGTLEQIIGGCQAHRVYSTHGISCTLTSHPGGGGSTAGLYIINKNHGEIRFRNNFNCIDANYYKGLDAHQARTGVLEVMLTEKRTEEAKRIRHENMKNGHDWSPRRGKELVPRNDGISNCLTSSMTKEHLLLSRCRIRRLTPRECFRLQGFSDEYYERAAKVNSDSQLYKQAGNSVTINVVYEIAKLI